MPLVFGESLECMIFFMQLYKGLAFSGTYGSRQQRISEQIHDIIIIIPVAEKTLGITEYTVNDAQLRDLQSHWYISS